MVGFFGSIALGFQRYFDFKGRSSRPEYWWWVLFTIIMAIGIQLMEYLVFGDDSKRILSTIWELTILIPSLSLGVRRLHDINRSGWWLLLWFAILIGWIVLFVWTIRRGDEGDNKYGGAPIQSVSR